MLRLLKYELRKTMLAKLILLAVTLTAQAVFLVGLWGKHDIPLALGAFMLFVIATNGILLIGILSVITLHRDTNTKLGYMLFMTPNSCFKILGAKVIECAVSILLAGAFFFALGMLDFSLLLGQGANEEIWNMFKEAVNVVIPGVDLNMPNLFPALVFRLLASWLCIITTVYLADMLASSLLYGKKANWLVVIPMFILMNWGISRLLTLIPFSIGVVPCLLWRGIAALVLGGIMYVVTARLMEKYLSV